MKPIQTLSDNLCDKQADDAHLRQADDLLSAFGFDAGGY